MVVYRMAETGLTRLPVVARNSSRKLVGMVSLDDLLKARVRNLEAERRRERRMFSDWQAGQVIVTYIERNVRLS